MRGVSFQLSQSSRIVSHVCEYHSLLEIVFTQYFVFAQVKAVADAKSENYKTITSNVCSAQTRFVVRRVICFGVSKQIAKQDVEKIIKLMDLERERIMKSNGVCKRRAAKDIPSAYGD